MSRLFEQAMSVGNAAHNTVEFPIPEWSKDPKKPIVAFLRALTDGEHNKVKAKSGSMKAYEETVPELTGVTRNVMEIDIARSAKNNADAFMVYFGLHESADGKGRFFRNTKEMEQAQDWIGSGAVFKRAAEEIRRLTEGQNGELLDIEAAKND